MKRRLSRYWLCLSLALAAAAPVRGADFSAWAHSARYTLTGYTRPEALTNFPVLLLFTNDGRFAYSQMQSEPYADLRFTDATRTNALSFEVEKWDTNGASLVWVRIPEIRDSCAAIHAFWGKAGETLPDDATNGAAWDDDELGVWHMAQAAAQDSTRNRFHGTAYGTVTPAAGIIGGADAFDADSDYIQVPDDPRFTLSGSYTVSAWLRPDPLSDYAAFIGTYIGSANGFIFTINNSASNHPQFWAAGQWRTNFVTCPDNAWSHLAYTRNGNEGRFYLNGVTTAVISNAVPGGDGGALQIGAGGATWSTYRFDGLLDEVRLSAAARSPAWLWASWKNQFDPAAFAPAADAASPLIRNEPANPVLAADATLNATLLEAGDSDTAVTVYWGTNDAGTAADAWAFTGAVSSAQAEGAVAFPVSNLLANQSYAFTFRATNADGDFMAGPSLRFKTAGPPAADNGSGASAVTYSSAQLSGTLLAGGFASVAFVWGETSGALTNRTAFASANEGPFSAVLTGLADGQPYYYRAYASNDYGAATADAESTFTTLDADMVWTGAGANTLASNPTNWSGGLAPSDGANVVLDGTSVKPMTWDLADVKPASWTQTETYTGTVTITTRYPGWGAFSNLVIRGDCTIAGGAWTHPANSGDTLAKDRLSVEVGGDFTLGAGGRIDLTGRGYAGERGPGAGNSSQRSMTSANYARAGSHGGVGSYVATGTNPAPCYGSALAPETLGSGGRYPGGGAVRLAVDGTATVDGTISAVASPLSMNPSGAGGSIFLKAGTVAGSGLLDVRSGDGYWTGGGGRIAVIATNAESFGDLVFHTHTGTGPNRGAAGTLYLETPSQGPGRGRLVIDSANIATPSWTELPPSFENPAVHPAISGELANVSLVVTNGGRTALDRSLRIGDFLWLSANATLELRGLALFIKADEPAQPFPQAFGGGLIATNGGRIVWGDEPATARISSTNGPNGTVLQSPGASGDYYNFGTVVQLTAVPDPGHAFLWWTGDVPAGSNRTSNPLPLTVGGTMDIKALFATNDPACRTWTGDGADALASNPSNWFPVLAPTAGVAVIFNASSLKACTWDVEAPLAGWRQETGYQTSYSLLDGYRGMVWIRTKFPGQGSFTNLLVTGDVTLDDGAWSHTGNYTHEVERLAVQVGGDFVLGSNAVINAAGRGYAALRGPGAGNNIQRNANQTGASHGGRGAYTGTNEPAATYGAITTPTTLGSGAGQAGGGAVRLAVAGQARIDGTIDASGGDVNNQVPGAAGGSIWLSAAAVAGQGTLQAMGTSGYQSGGGGRIAVILDGSDDFGGLVLRAWGGPGSATPGNAGAAGTVYRQSPSDRRLLVENGNITVVSTNWHTQLPASLDPPAEDLSGTVLVMTNRGWLALTDSLVMRDLFVHTNSLLYLKGHDLRLRTLYHDDWGTPARVVYDDGRILWPATGTVIMIQ